MDFNYFKVNLEAPIAVETPIAVDTSKFLLKNEFLQYIEAQKVFAHSLRIESNDNLQEGNIIESCGFSSTNVLKVKLATENSNSIIGIYSGMNILNYQKFARILLVECVSIGDLITVSSISGLGKKQSDDSLKSSTVGKAISNCKVKYKKESDIIFECLCIVYI